MCGAGGVLASCIEMKIPTLGPLCRGLNANTRPCGPAEPTPGASVGTREKQDLEPEPEPQTDAAGFGARPPTARGFGTAQLDQSGSQSAIRGRDQQMIGNFRGKGISANGINGVGPRNAKRDTYLPTGRLRRVRGVLVTRRTPRVGAVIQIRLTAGWYAYGRVLRDASVAFYADSTKEPGLPPIGSRKYEFSVGVYGHVLRSQDVSVVGYDPSQSPDDDWPPPYSITDVISGGTEIYYRGAITPASEADCRHLEPAAAWDLPHLTSRLRTVLRGPR